ncbi:redoxin family protein [Mycoplasmopsis columbinasalis]|uniref:Thiol peroxidase n=1 Tax=Mycoplasmopsis columbinasalis TaxID=114880 RepID=A0A449BAW9_9BACT|nr:redoxin family protein [Mycoplasmopsis columbinasalis]VEU78318.1 thiol peroxidase [Mycoplasmopsis columbinasalis]
MERTVTLGHLPLTLHGKEAELGQQINLVGAKAGGFVQEKVARNHEFAVLGVFPSINTNVCDLQVLELGKLSEKYTDFDFFTFSVDLPSALGEYKAGHPTGRVELYSDYYNRNVGVQLGVLINELHLLARGLFILDKDNKVVYKQINDVVSSQADFPKLEAELKKLSK